MSEPGASVYERTAPYFAKTRAAAYRDAAAAALAQQYPEPKGMKVQRPDAERAGWNGACRQIAARLEQMAREMEDR